LFGACVGVGVLGGFKRGAASAKGGRVVIMRDDFRNAVMCASNFKAEIKLPESVFVPALPKEIVL
jgi:hypothetical protein